MLMLPSQTMKTTIALLNPGHQLMHDVRPVAAARAITLESAPAGVDVVAWLATRQPALVFVDLSYATAQWLPTITAVKTSPATRKLRLVVLGTDPNVLLLAERAGCDASELLEKNTDFSAILDQYLPAVPDQHELLRQSALPLPDLARHGVEEFNAGQYFEQHESFEHCWRAEPGPVRALYQAILQIGVAYYQIVRGNYNGARKMFLRSQQYLTIRPDVCQTIDVARLRADAAAAFAELSQVGEANIARFDRRLLTGVHYAN